MRRIGRLHIWLCYGLILYHEWKEIIKAKSIVWESEFNNTPKYLRDFRSKKGVSFGGVLSSTTYAELVRATQRTIGLLYLGGNKSEVNSCCIGF